MGGHIIYLEGYRNKEGVIRILHGNKARDTRVASIKCTFETECFWTFNYDQTSLFIGDHL